MYTPLHIACRQHAAARAPARRCRASAPRCRAEDAVGSAGVDGAYFVAWSLGNAGNGGRSPVGGRRNMRAEVGEDGEDQRPGPGGGDPLSSVSSSAALDFRALDGGRLGTSRSPHHGWDEADQHGW